MSTSYDNELICGVTLGRIIQYDLNCGKSIHQCNNAHTVIPPHNPNSLEDRELFDVNSIAVCKFNPNLFISGNNLSLAFL